MRAAEIASRWARDGHEVTVIAPECACEAFPPAAERPASLRFVFTERGVRPSSVLSAYLRRTRAAHRALHALALEWKGDFVLYSATDSFPDVLPCRRAAAKCHVRWVGCCFHLIEHWKTRPGNKAWNFLSYFQQRFALSKLRQADRVVVDNSGLKKDLADKCGFAPERIAVQTCGVRVSGKTPPSARSFDIAFCGRVVFSKGILDFVPLLDALAEKGFPNATVGIVGRADTEFETEVRAELERAGLTGRVSLLGPLPEDERDAVVAASKVFVSLSHEEGWGMAVAEAMALGRPVVAYDLPCYREVFPSLFRTASVGDVSAVASHVAALLSDPALRDAEGARGRVYVNERYSYDAVARDELSVLAEEDRR